MELVIESDYRRLATALADVEVLMNIIALLPYAVRVPAVAPRRVGDRIPAQRRESDGMPWSMVHATAKAQAVPAVPVAIPQQRTAPRPAPQGLPPAPRFRLPRRVQ